MKNLKKIQNQLKKDSDSIDVTLYRGKDGGQYDQLVKKVSKKIKTLQAEYSEVFIMEKRV